MGQDPDKDLDSMTHMYAVVNPATGERLRDFPTITDAELESAIAGADEAHRTRRL